MVVAGAPERHNRHAELVCNMALDMVDAITDLKDPSTGKKFTNRSERGSKICSTNRKPLADSSGSALRRGGCWDRGHEDAQVLSVW
jgi:hypothetical protein